MNYLTTIVEFIFGAGLFINGLLFVPQIIKLYTSKNASGVSLLTFAGFLLIQLTIVLHGYIHRDYLLMFGYLFSMLTCGLVVLLTLIYRKK